MQNLENRGKLPPTSPPSPSADPVFPSSHAALKFALHFSHGSLRTNLLAAASAYRGNAEGLSGLDGAAQAGMILAELTNLTVLRQKLLVGRYAPQTTPCGCKSPCCGGFRLAAEWSTAIEYLTHYVLVAQLTGSVSHFRLRRSLVVRYFGVRESFTAMAAECGVNRHTAGDYNKRVQEHFKVEERPAFHEIDGRLKAAGIVSS